MKEVVSTPAVNVCVSVWGKCLTQFYGYSGWELPEALKQANFEIVPIGSELAEFYISLEFDLKSLWRVRKTVPRKGRLLWALEPRAVTPIQHSRVTKLLFGGKVVQSALQQTDEETYVQRMGYLPNFQNLQKLLDEYATRSNRKNQVCVINENKFSFVRGNGYKRRRQLIKAFSKSGQKMSVAGRHWEKGTLWMLDKQIRALLYCLVNLALPDLRNFSFVSLRRARNIEFVGRVESEFKFISEHEFNLVVENDPNYISEKLFNSIISGAIPIFVGPDLELFQIPTQIAMCFAPRSSTEEVLKRLTELSEADKSLMRSKGFDWISNLENQEIWNHNDSFHTFSNFARKYFDEEIAG